MIASTLLLVCLTAEQWADEPVPPPAPAPLNSPRVGPVGGVHLGLSRLSTLGPEVGVRGGVRVRLGQRAALSLFADVEFLEIEQFRGMPPIPAQRLLGFARIELISSSATSVMLVPKLTAGLYFGAGPGFAPGEPPASLFAGGLHLALTRLDPSGWWFPVFFDLGLDWAAGGSPGWRFAIGIGI